jgi:hypothetical protein
MLHLARDMGFTAAITSRDPSDEAMFEGILDWAGRRADDKYGHGTVCEVKSDTTAKLVLTRLGNSDSRKT